LLPDICASMRERDRPHFEQRIDEEAQARIGRHTPGTGMRRIDQARILEIHHHIAHRGRRQIQGQNSRDGTRSDGLAGVEIGFDEAAEDVARALVELGEPRQALIDQGLLRVDAHGANLGTGAVTVNLAPGENGFPHAGHLG
jgi:hypothetical protein